MAAKKVENYLDYHKIGPLFEDLMAKLIKEMPDQPVPFLIKLLKKQSPEDNIPHSRPPSGSKSRSPMSSTCSMGLTGKPVPRQSLDDSREFRRSALAKSWAAPDNRPSSASKSREYERPWLKGSKKVKGEHSNKENTKHVMRRTDERPGSWNADTKVPFGDFDEWFEAQNKKPKSAGPQSKDMETKQSWQDDQEDLDSSMDKRGIGYPLQVNIKPTHPPVQVDDDLEGEEISFSRHRKTRGESSEGNSVSSYSSGRSSKKNARNAAEEHRKQLQSLLLNSNDSGCQSQHHKLSDDDKDDATELLESSNELENEGVAKPVHSGYKLSKSFKAGTSAQESVKVSICARCARIISGLPSDQRSDAGSNFSNGTDDEFESVSQTGSVTGGPARITWPSGFDSESDAVTPRKAKPMWEKPDSKQQKQKGKHMYNRNSSTFLTDLAGSPSPRPISAASDRSDDMFTPRPGKGWQQKKTAEYSSDNDTDVNVNYGRSSPSTTRLAEGRPWARPLDSASEAGSEDWTLDRSKKVSFKSKGFRRSYLTDDSDQ